MNVLGGQIQPVHWLLSRCGSKVGQRKNGIGWGRGEKLNSSSADEAPKTENGQRTGRLLCFSDHNHLFTLHTGLVILELFEQLFRE